MANNVFANGREISCKSGSGKSIAAFPDVCMTPPENPATPPGVPVPYPNTGNTSDCTSGSTTVKVTDKEAMLKNKSYFKKSMGDEAGSAAKKGVVTSVNRGKVYFTMWSMDVKIEGENAVRHLDLTTHNHGSTMNTPPIVFVDRMAVINSVAGCAKEKKAIEEACGNPVDEEKTKCPDGSAVMELRSDHVKICEANPTNKKKNPGLSASAAAANKKVRKASQAKVDAELRNYSKAIRANECQQALRCALVPFKQAKNGGCCPPQTPEHLIPAAMFGKTRGTDNSMGRFVSAAGAESPYDCDKAACLCAEGGAQRATHGLLGRGRRKYLKKKGLKTGGKTTDRITVSEAAKCGATSAGEVFPQCDPDCLQAQLEANHEAMGMDPKKDKVAPVQSNDGKKIDPLWEQEFDDMLST